MEAVHYLAINEFDSLFRVRSRSERRKCESLACPCSEHHLRHSIKCLHLQQTFETTFPTTALAMIVMLTIIFLWKRQLPDKPGRREKRGQVGLFHLHEEASSLHIQGVSRYLISAE
jgi:hypothetical protein